MEVEVMSPADSKECQRIQASSRSKMDPRLPFLVKDERRRDLGGRERDTQPRIATPGRCVGHFSKVDTYRRSKRNQVDYLK